MKPISALAVLAILYFTLSGEENTKSTPYYIKAYNEVAKMGHDTTLYINKIDSINTELNKIKSKNPSKLTKEEILNKRNLEWYLNEISLGLKSLRNDYKIFEKYRKHLHPKNLKEPSPYRIS